jgi:hypothetical protein
MLLSDERDPPCDETRATAVPAFFVPFARVAPPDFPLLLPVAFFAICVAPRELVCASTHAMLVRIRFRFRSVAISVNRHGVLTR